MINFLKSQLEITESEIMHAEASDLAYTQEYKKLKKQKRLIKRILRKLRSKSEAKR